MINMTTTSMSGSKEQTRGKGAHQNMLNRFGTTSMVTSWNDQYFSGFWRVWHIYQLTLEMKKNKNSNIYKKIN